MKKESQHIVLNQITSIYLTGPDGDRPRIASLYSIVILCGENKGGTKTRARLFY
jgi:hypothetical protein